MSGKFRYICEICGKKFYLSHDCKRHKELVHGDKTLQVCGSCLISLSQILNLKP